MAKHHVRQFARTVCIRNLLGQIYRVNGQLIDRIGMNGNQSYCILSCQLPLFRGGTYRSLDCVFHGTWRELPVVASSSAKCGIITSFASAASHNPDGQPKKLEADLLPSVPWFISSTDQACSRKFTMPTLSCNHTSTDGSA